MELDENRIGDAVLDEAGDDGATVGWETHYYRKRGQLLRFQVPLLSRSPMY